MLTSKINVEIQINYNSARENEESYSVVNFNSFRLYSLKNCICCTPSESYQFWHAMINIVVEAVPIVGLMPHVPLDGGRLSWMAK